ncbi:MAG: DinB family protein [Chloroflexi bacterium]|nr:DinB family protein [Chloroflexota bacterium]
MNPQQVSTLFDYHYASFDRIRLCAAALSQDQFVAGSSYSVGSVRNQLAHCLMVDNRWLARLNGQRPPEMEYADFPDQATLWREWDKVRQQVMAYVNRLNAEQLDEVVDLQFPDRGGLRRSRRWQILFHMVNHGTDHRAQILALLGGFGAATFEQDLILHLWSTEQ